MSVFCRSLYWLDRRIDVFVNLHVTSIKNKNTTPGVVPGYNCVCVYTKELAEIGLLLEPTVPGSQIMLGIQCPAHLFMHLDLCLVEVGFPS